jgi:hypothetical protein
MSEQTLVDVVLPLEREPVGRENIEVLKLAFQTARRLVSPLGGRVLGIVTITKGLEAENANMAWKVTFKVAVPEKVQHHRRSFALN